MKKKAMKIGIVTARFNELITSRLQEGAKRALVRAGVAAADILEIEVAGSFELPLAAQWLIDTKQVEGVVALGAVIKGSTDHYDYVCSTASSGLMQTQLSRSVPVGFGVLTCETLEQALDRAGGKLGNKGSEVAMTVVEMAMLKTQLRESK